MTSNYAHIIVYIIAANCVICDNKYRNSRLENEECDRRKEVHLEG